jgi:hypothetical protein
MAFNRIPGLAVFFFYLVSRLMARRKAILNNRWHLYVHAAITAQNQKKIHLLVHFYNYLKMSTSTIIKNEEELIRVGIVKNHRRHSAGSLIQHFVAINNFGSDGVPRMMMTTSIYPNFVKHAELCLRSLDIIDSVPLVLQA